MGVHGGAFGKKTSRVPRDWAEPGRAEPGRAGAELSRAVPGEPGRVELCRAEPGRAEPGRDVPAPRVPSKCPSPCSLQVALAGGVSGELKAK